MRIHYFNDPDTATTFTFENDEGVDDQQEMNDFTQWLSSVNTNFMKLKIKNSKSFNTYVVVAKDNSVSESYDIVNETTGDAMRDALKEKTPAPIKAKVDADNSPAPVGSKVTQGKSNWFAGTSWANN